MRKTKFTHHLGSKVIASLQPERFIWKTMNRSELRWLALAVGLAFAAFGPLITLMRPDGEPFSWLHFFTITVSSGALAGSILLYGYKARNLILIVILFTTTIVAASALVKKNAENSQPSTSQGAALSGSSGDGLAFRKNFVAVVGLVCTAASYGVFLQVVSKGLRAKGALEAEISIAQEIQQSLIPTGTVRTAWCEIAGLTIPATEVGGDYFDIIELDNQRVLVAIGDVSGHGVGAGILSAMAKSALYSQLESHRTIVEAMEILNKTIYAVTDKKTFMTFCLLLLDRGAGTAQFVSAGHPPVLYKTADSQSIELLRTPNLGIGLVHSTRFRQLEIPLQADSTFFLYTDGIFEATNRRGEEFGEARLQAFFRNSQTDSTEILCRQAIETIRTFTEKTTMQDDTTLVAVRILA